MFFCRFLECCEALGHTPDQVAQIIIVLLAKPNGGSRPIGLLGAIYRVWSRARRHLVQQWEQQFASYDFFSTGKGRSATDVVYRHTIRSEFATQNDTFFAAVLRDGENCYERIRHLDLVRSALRHQYPLALLRMSVKA